MMILLFNKVTDSELIVYGSYSGKKVNVKNKTKFRVREN